MMTHDPENLDRATAARLSRMSTMPVDTSALDRALRSAIPTPGRRGIGGWVRPLRAAAAVALIALSITVAAWLTSGGAVLASPAQMAQVHRDLVANRIAAVKVDSIEEASRVLTGDGSSSAGLPEAPDAHVMACCMKSIKNKKVACILLRDAGVPVTMSVADAEDMRLPKAPSVVREGERYYTQSVDNLNMVMTERNGRWVCLIGELPSERLVEIAARLKF